VIKAVVAQSGVVQGSQVSEERTCALLEVEASKSKKMQGSVGRDVCCFYLMQYAIDRRTKRVVQADQVRRTDRNRAYECPVCKAEVHYRRAMGLSPEPGFAHNAHVARQDCHLYHPSFGVESPEWRGGAAATEPINKIDLCLDDPLDDKNTWSLFLRFPEISDLGNARLRALVGGSVSVVTGSSSASISLMDLRPGVGIARLVVPPSMSPYQASPAGHWPPDLSSDRWTGTCEGLNPRGTPFVLRKGEWERLRNGGELELGSEIRIVAEVRNAPPPACSVEALAITPHSKLDWRVWRVFLPDSISTSLDRWAEAINVTLASPADEVALLGIPQGFDSNGPVFTTGSSLIAKVKWAAGEPSAALTLGTPLGSESTSTWPTQTSPAYMVFGTYDSGSTTLTANYDRRTTETIETAVAPTLDEIRNILRATPRFEIVIGDTTVSAWQDPVALSSTVEQAAPPPITICPNYDALQFDVEWTTQEGAQYAYGLTAAKVQERLSAAWGQDADFEISAGAFGCIRLRFLRPKQSRDAASVSRAMRWATLAGGRTEASTSAWLRRGLAAKGVPLRDKTRNGSRRWLPLLVNEVKRLQK